MTFFSRPGWRMVVGPVLSAALLGLFIRGGHYYLIGFVAFVPWMLSLNATRTIAGTLGNGVVMSIALTLTVFMWFGHSIGRFAQASDEAGLMVLLAVAPLFQPQIVAFVIARHLAGRYHGPVLRAVAGASAYVATEWLVPKVLGDTIGYAVHPSIYLRQFADLGGAAGITFVLILINEAIAAAIVRRRDGARAWIKPLALAATMFVAMIGYGVIRLTMLDMAPPDSGPPLRVGMVQSNIYDYEGLRKKHGVYAVVRMILDTHFEMSQEAVEYHRVDAVMWSETVYPITFDHPKTEGVAQLDSEIKDFVKSSGVPLIFGTYDIDAKGEYNAAAFVKSDGNTLGFYRKTNPFLFTEYVPPWLEGPLLRRLIPFAGTWKPGDGARVFPLQLANGREIPVVPLVCLDETRPDVALQGANLGAQVILSMSNDSWFQQPGGTLHLAVATFRSIETRMPLLRVTQSGVSAAIDTNGSLLAYSPDRQQYLLVGEVPVRQPPPTLMKAWGNWVGRAGIGVLLLMTIAAALRWWHRRRARIAAPSTTNNASAHYRDDVVVLAPVWRIAVSLLGLFACGGLMWVGLTILMPGEIQANRLSQIWMFAGLVLAPATSAWAILRAFAGTADVEGDSLVIEQREQRIEIRASDIVALKPWTLPIPKTGVWLTLASGQRWSHGITTNDPEALAAALVRAGAQPTLADTLAGRAFDYARTRAAIILGRLDHPLTKFVLFPLVPALPAFRLHQHIAFGGTFGEYYTYGLKAYLIALLIWWATWAIGLVCFAAVLRVLIEAGTMLSIALKPTSAIDTRKTLEMLGRLVFYVGVPAWLVIRFWPW